MAVVLAVALLISRGDDPVGEAMLALARAAVEGS
jgi:hypothetical protein